METLGASGWLGYFDLMPRADARLLAMEDVRLRPGSRWCARVGKALDVNVAVTPLDASSFSSSSAISLSTLF